MAEKESIDRTLVTHSDTAKLKVLRIEPASKCNLACNHCPTGTVDIPRDIMSDQVFERVLQNFEKYKDEIEVIVLYHGGEPLLNNNIYRMINVIKSIKSSIFIKTVSNGMILNQNKADLMLGTPIDLIEFSLDGLDSNENQRVRVNCLSEHT